MMDSFLPKVRTLLRQFWWLWLPFPLGLVTLSLAWAATQIWLEESAIPVRWVPVALVSGLIGLLTTAPAVGLLLLAKKVFPKILPELRRWLMTLTLVGTIGLNLLAFPIAVVGSIALICAQEGKTADAIRLFDVVGLTMSHV